MTTATTMKDQAGGNGQVAGPGNGADGWFDRMGQFARAAGPGRWRWATGAVCASVLLVAGASVSCDSATSVPPVPAEAYLAKPGGSLAPGDEIRVIFSGAPELNTQQKIQPNGKVGLPTIGEVTATGRSVTTLQRQLTSLYQPTLQDSTVTVSLVGTTAGVYVSGAVLRAGKIPFDRPMTVLEAVMEAGGFSSMANPKRVTVVRTEDGKSKNYLLDLQQALQGSESTPFYVRPYDVIYVKEKTW